MGCLDGPRARSIREGYLKASVDLRDRRRARRVANDGRRAERRAPGASRLRALVAVLSVAALVAATLTVVATNESDREATRPQGSPPRESSRTPPSPTSEPTQSEHPARDRGDRRTRSFDGSVLPEAEDALHQAVGASRIGLTVPGVGGVVAWAPHGVFAAEAPRGPGSSRSWTLIRDRASSLRFKGHDGDVTDVAFSPDGSTLATTGEDGMLETVGSRDGSTHLEQVRPWVRRRPLVQR